MAERARLGHKKSLRKWNKMRKNVDKSVCWSPFSIEQLFCSGCNWCLQWFPKRARRRVVALYWPIFPNGRETKVPPTLPLHTQTLPIKSAKWRNSTFFYCYRRKGEEIYFSFNKAVRRWNKAQAKKHRIPMTFGRFPNNQKKPWKCVLLVKPKLGSTLLHSIPAVSWSTLLPRVINH